MKLQEALGDPAAVVLASRVDDKVGLRFKSCSSWWPREQRERFNGGAQVDIGGSSCG